MSEGSYNVNKDLRHNVLKSWPIIQEERTSFGPKTSLENLPSKQRIIFRNGMLSPSFQMRDMEAPPKPLTSSWPTLSYPNKVRATKIPRQGHLEVFYGGGIRRGEWNQTELLRNLLVGAKDIVVCPSTRLQNR